MKETTERKKTKITLEDLLQIKRAERPSPDFWPHFERELRAKQLAAIVETRPWWRLVVARKFLVRWCVPLGAAAMVAMVFGSFRGVRVPSSCAPIAGEQVALPEPLTTARAEAFVSAVQGRSTVVNHAGSFESLVQADGSASCSAVDLAQSADHHAVNATTQDAELIAVSANPVDPSLAQVIGTAGIEVSLGADPVAAVEPLNEVTPPHDSRRSRLLAYSVSFDPHAANSSDAVRSRERITHRLSDDSVYDSIARLALSANRVSIKF